VSLICGSCVEREKAVPDTAAPQFGGARGSVPSGGNREGQSTDAGDAGGLTRSSCEVPAGHGGSGAKGSGHPWFVRSINRARGVWEESRERAEVSRQVV
jgi:hypothetical protein